MLTLLHLATLTAVILGLARFLPDVEAKGMGTAVVVAVVFSVLNFLLGWAIHAVLFVPALLTLGLLFFFIPFIVNATLLWLTDRLIGSFAIKSARALLISAGAITLANWLFHVVVNGHRLARM